MLDSSTVKKISDFVYVKPRTIQEIAFLLQKNWRTANTYVERIERESGSLSTRTFREGTRGALKIVFWNNTEKIHSSEAQERLFNRIIQGKAKEDFSPFDIYQYVDEGRKSASLELVSEESKTRVEEFTRLVKSAQKQVLLFSGNASFVNLPYGKKRVIDLIEELAEKKASVKVLARVELPGMDNILELIAINERAGYDVVEVRHCEQPLRATVVDSEVARLKEEKSPEKYKKGELQKNAFIFYEIYDKDWVEWLQKVFWSMFRTAIPARKRIAELRDIAKQEKENA